MVEGMIRRLMRLFRRRPKLRILTLQEMREACAGGERGEGGYDGERCTGLNLLRLRSVIQAIYFIRRIQWTAKNLNCCLMPVFVGKCAPSDHCFMQRGAFDRTTGMSQRRRLRGVDINFLRHHFWRISIGSDPAQHA